MLAEVNWIFTIPASVFGGIFCLGLSLVICLCGCRTKEPKDELTGVEGRVKITNPDEYQEEVNANKISLEVPTDKLQKSAKRSLPDLPLDPQLNGRNDITWEPNGDASSELYATVVLQDEKGKRHRRQKSDSDSTNPSMTYVKDHPYDKLKKVEHPYAQLTDHESEQRSSSKLHSIAKKERKSDVDKNNDDHDDDDDDEDDDDDDDENNANFENKRLSLLRSTREEQTSTIAAATAITGHVTASDDLPYMTPPAHFSGDSQDSGKGYTSISVREPLSAIRAESEMSRNKRSDPHYATVSDDSDDMYAAIDDPNQVYTSESETYARIHSESNKPKGAPQPPSVDSLKQMTITPLTHSRQASSSSLTNSTVVNSPKPEKRPANSPLPPTPTKIPDAIDDYSHLGENVIKQSGSPKNVEDMYAKVNKKVRNREVDHLERECSTESGVSESSDSLSFRLQGSTSISTTETSRSCHSHLSKSTLTDVGFSPSPTSSPSSTSPTSSAAFSSSNGQNPTTSLSSETDPRSGYEKLHGSSLEFDRKSDPGYETVNRGLSSESDPEYEKLKPQNPNDGYARVKCKPQENEIYSKIDGCESYGYASVENPENTTGDDGYAKVCKGMRSSFPPKEECEETGRRREFGEPTYESLAGEHEVDDSGDPNYESVRFVQDARERIEPPYQLLRDCESGRPVQN